MHALAAASAAGAINSPFKVLLILASIAAYWAPTIVAAVRHVPSTGSVAVINGFLGWTIIGWIIALAMACRSHPQAGHGTPPAPVPQPGSERSR
jgi:hypothetical protein